MGIVPEDNIVHRYLSQFIQQYSVQPTLTSGQPSRYTLTMSGFIKRLPVIPEIYTVTRNAQFATNETYGKYSAKEVLSL